MTRTNPWSSASSPPPAWPQQESDASRDCGEVEGGLSRTGRQNQREHDKRVVGLGLVWLFFQRYFVQVDLDHLLLDGGWKRGEFEWLK